MNNRVRRWLAEKLRSWAELVEPTTIDGWSGCICEPLDLGPDNASYWADPAKYHANQECPNLAWALRGRERR